MAVHAPSTALEEATARVGSLAGVRTAAVTAALLSTLALAAPAAGNQREPTELEALTQRRAAAQVELDAVTAELEAVSGRVGEAEEERGRLREELEELQLAAEAAQEVLAARAVQAYRSPAAAAVEVILSARSSEAALVRARLLEGLDRQEIRELERAEVARAAYAQRRAKLSSLEASLRSDEERLAELRDRLERAFAEASARKSELVSRRARQRTVSRQGQRGRYSCPLGQPLSFRDTWGDPRSGGRSHKGVDLFAAMGADAYAITDGAILRHSSSALGGLGLYLAGDDGNVYYYAHLASILPDFRPGRRVEAGERIAVNGDSGNARGGAPHIHLEVRPGGGSSVNPYPYVAAACL